MAKTWVLLGAFTIAWSAVAANVQSGPASEKAVINGADVSVPRIAARRFAKTNRDKADVVRELEKLKITEPVAGVAPARVTKIKRINAGPPAFR